MALLREELEFLIKSGQHKTWEEFFIAEMEKDYFKNLDAIVSSDMENNCVYPPLKSVFAAFALPVDMIKVIILGQDPYHGEGEAMGLSFSVKNGIKCPPSLRNIKKELVDDYGPEYETENTDLSSWADEGVFLLNTLLTVVKDAPLSHSKTGWDTFTKNAVKFIAEKAKEPLVAILWGGHAQSFEKLFSSNPEIHIIKSAHPSPLSSYRGFFGSKPFSKANEYLAFNGITPIDWRIL
jgi:uracil-DNA glycosylase